MGHTGHSALFKSYPCVPYTFFNGKFKFSGKIIAYQLVNNPSKRSIRNGLKNQPIICLTMTYLFKILLASLRLMFTPMLRNECWISAASTWPGELSSHTVRGSFAWGGFSFYPSLVRVSAILNSATIYTHRLCSGPSCWTWSWAVFHECGDTGRTPQSPALHPGWCLHLLQSETIFFFSYQGSIGKQSLKNTVLLGLFGIMRYRLPIMFALLQDTVWALQ